jgi:hypothetical protein
MWDTTNLNAFSLGPVIDESETGRVPLNIRTSVHGPKTKGRSPNLSSSPKGEATITKNLLGFLLLNALKEGQP